jgi:FkbM family methyltransferase
MGAHIGTICIPISKFVKEVVAFEANPKTYELFKTNLILNGCTNVSSHNLAVSDHYGTIDFLMSKHNSGGSKRFPKIEDEIYFYDSPERIKVPCVPIDDFLHGRTFDVIFMDIEGSEYFAMKGMEKMLSNDATLTVITEFIPHHLKNVASVSVEQFADCLRDFKTFIIPTLNKMTHDFNEFVILLKHMYDNGLEDEGIIIHKKLIEVEFA